MKKPISIILTLLIVFSLCSCGKKDAKPYEQTDKPGSPTVTSEPPRYVVNPLTGIQDLPREKENLRPVAIMVNNIVAAQKVQTGLNKADIVYETYVEGGITRLLAVYKDIASVGQIGTVRSARYSYVDLALGHDALYIHAGIDKTYCLPYANKNTDHVDLLSGKGGSISFREKNGLSSEHTLYTTGEKISAGMGTMKKRSTTDSTAPWVTFNSPDAPVTPDVTLAEGAPVTKITVPMSKAYTSDFLYNEATKTYSRAKNGTAYKDYKTGDEVSVTNVFVLFTNVTPFEDNYHVREYLDSGTGYYISQGGYEEINWKKGNSTDGFKFTKSDGSDLKVNAGKSWVFIANQNIKNSVIFA